MAESLGARLRQQRERQQVALAAIADQTKISVSLLEDLERDDVSRWPVGIFRRSFIRAYSRAIGLESDAVVREFLELHPDPIDVIETVPAAPSGADGRSVTERPPTRLRCLLDAAVESLAGHRLFQRREPVLDSVSDADCGPATPASQPEPGGVDATPTSPPEPGPVDAPPASQPEAGPVDATSPQEAGPVDATPVEATPTSQPAMATSRPEPDLVAAASLCTELGRVLQTRDVAPLLEAAAGILDAAGLIVWVADAQGTALRPVLAHGYSDEVLAKVPRVCRDTDNATATAFRSARTRIVNGGDRGNGAVVVPMLTPGGCVGVLALELRHGGEQRDSVRALATIFAAQLAPLVEFATLAGGMDAARQDIEEIDYAATAPRLAGMNLR
jgi:transcriptional regulator with XRE-family HTH domain